MLLRHFDGFIQSSNGGSGTIHRNQDFFIHRELLSYFHPYTPLAIAVLPILLRPDGSGNGGFPQNFALIA
jgi:hypothetical protein